MRRKTIIIYAAIVFVISLILVFVSIWHISILNSVQRFKVTDRQITIYSDKWQPTLEAVYGENVYISYDITIKRSPENINMQLIVGTVTINGKTYNASYEKYNPVTLFEVLDRQILHMGSYYPYTESYGNSHTYSFPGDKDGRTISLSFNTENGSIYLTVTETRYFEYSDGSRNYTLCVYR